MKDFIITASQLQAELDRDPVKITLVDVRGPDEHLDCHIEGSLLIPLDELMQRALRELDPEADIVVYCAVGVRSMHAAVALRQLGFAKVRSLQGGIDAWLKNDPPRDPS